MCSEPQAGPASGAGGSSMEAVVRLGGRWFRLDRPVSWVEAGALDEVTTRLDEVESAVSDGLCAVGFLAYEAAPAFDRALLTVDPPRGADASPLLGFALFERLCSIADPVPPFADEGAIPLELTELQQADEHRRALGSIRRAIAAGTTYQVNYTFPIAVARAGEPQRGGELLQGLFAQLCRGQGGAHACLLRSPAIEIASGSPELFFELREGLVTTRPMKGTAPRGRFGEEDRERATELRASAKERAENLMIVDMMRNDLGRIARPGSVQVRGLFDVERLPTLHQMTSTVVAETDAGPREILASLFPCASITGAPKVSAMAAIRELETAPRGPYTGAVGVILPDLPEAVAGRHAWEIGRPVAAPDLYACFAVGIRTAWRRRGAPSFRYGVGSGVVWDSDPDAELAECRAKALALRRERPSFRLLETLLVRPARKTGAARPSAERIWLWPEHLARLEESADYFGFSFDGDRMACTVTDHVADLDPLGAHRVRLLLDTYGRLELETAPLAPRRPRPAWTIGFATEPVDSADPFLFHKTTQRQVYEESLRRARALAPDLDDVLLWNERGEITESSFANLLVEPEGVGRPWRTPPRRCGLLAGTLRTRLLRRGWIIESTVTREQVLQERPRLLLANSVRGLIPVSLEDAT